eukprot:gb/GFBE01049206.1/.p1 GENE.gb/GFBE01049206.1/~~gb/GFBE01049206.1/.p1  ORF type:complete len:493 (+),score=93.16 gb/GFBE01049206.1/:1-1479(+)
MWKMPQMSPFLHEANSSAVPQRGLGLASAELSNTVSLSDPDGNWPIVDEKVTAALSEFGEIARLDTSLVAVARCILVTYFDVRCAQRLLMSGMGRAEPFPPAAHDCRTLRVNMVAFAEKVDQARGGFSQFGEVADISLQNGDAIVEFYDIRSGQLMLAASGGTATPWVPEARHQPAALLPKFASDLLGALNGPALRGAQSTFTAVSRGSLSMTEDGSQSRESADSGDKKKAAERGGNRPARTKVATKEYQKYDIDTDKIQSGKDSRTTVMVRNISNGCTRKTFLQFLDKCSLGDRFTFFYMPCKEHRNVPAGFAFINFVSPSDVLKLCVMLKAGTWAEFAKGQQKSPAVSYARFQGHEELASHFSSSAVLHEQDPEKRPIFRPEALAKVARERQERNKASMSGAAPSYPTTAASILENSGAFNDIGLVEGRHGGGLDTLLSARVDQIAAILNRQRDHSDGKVSASYLGSSTQPAYLKTPSSFEHFAPQHMGA